MVQLDGGKEVEGKRQVQRNTALAEFSLHQAETDGTSKPQRVERQRAQ